jgi:hypothetical protein
MHSTINRAALDNVAMVSGREKEISLVIDGGTVRRWVGFGWVDEGAPTEEQWASLPRVVDPKEAERAARVFRRMTDHLLARLDSGKPLPIPRPAARSSATATASATPTRSPPSPAAGVARTSASKRRIASLSTWRRSQRSARPSEGRHLGIALSEFRR